MKHIKTYEGQIIDKFGKTYKRPLYKKGDHVILNDKVIEQNSLTDIYKNIGVIVSRLKHANNSYMYDVNYMNDQFELVNIFDHYVLESQIIRKMTKKEVTYLYSNIQANKFNL